MLFLACESVRNSLLKFLVAVMGAQICPPRQKTPKFGFQTQIFSRAWKWKGVVPNKFPRLFGMYLTPPDHQNIKIFFWRVATIFAKRHWFFAFLGLYIETPGLYLETRGSAGISRVNVFALKKIVIVNFCMFMNIVQHSLLVFTPLPASSRCPKTS